MTRALVVLGALIVVGCRSMPTREVAAPCRAVGTVTWSVGGKQLEGTAVAHFAEPSTLFLRFVDPAGRTLGELRTDGRNARVSRNDAKAFWEGEGARALEELLGIAMTAEDWVDLVRGRGRPPEGWLAVRSEVGCLARSLRIEGEDRSGRGILIAFRWDVIESWPEGQVELGPPPAGYERVDVVPELVGDAFE